MQIKTLRLVNYGCFVDRTFVFSPGCTAIVGPNGSGKSTIVRAIHYALSGSTLPAKVCIHHKADPKDPAYVEATFECEGLEIFIKRSLRPAKHYLKAVKKTDGSGEGFTEAVSTEEGVRDLLQELAQTTPGVLCHHLIVNQWDLFSFLDATDASRIEYFSELFDTSVCAAITHGLKAAERSIVVSTAKIEAQRLEETIEKQLQYLEQLKRQIPHEAAHEEIQKRLRSLQRQLQLDTLARERKDAKQRATQRLERLGKQLEEAKRLLHDTEKILQAKAAKYRIAEKDFFDLVAKAEHGVGDFLELQEIQKQLEGCQVRDFLQEIHEVTTNHDDIQEIYRHIQTRRENLADLIHGAELPSGTCPTCGQGLTDLIEKLPSLIQERQEAEDALEELSQDLKVLREQKQELQREEKRLQLLLGSQARLTKKLEGIPAELFPDAQSSCIAIKAAESYRRDILSLTSAIDQERSREVAYQEDWIVDREKIEQEVEELTKESQRLHKLLGAKQIHVQTIQEASERLESLQQRIPVDEAREELKKQLSLASECFSRDVLPRKVAYLYLDYLCRSLDDVFSAAGVALQLRSDEKLKFLVHRDGMCYEAKHLSGGEKVVVALALRSAIRRLLCRHLGVWVLDEPTAGLDVDRLGFVKTVLEQLQAGQQVLLVTHEQTLAGMFANVLDLAKHE